MYNASIHTCRCKDNEFNANGQLFFQPLLQAMRTMIHLGETLPDTVQHPYHVSAGLLVMWAVIIFGLMLATFGIGAASGARAPPPPPSPRPSPSPLPLLPPTPTTFP